MRRTIQHALEAIRGERTISDLATKHQLHPNQITLWKRQAIENLAEAFDDKASDAQVGREAEVTKLRAKIGQFHPVGRSPPCAPRGAKSDAEGQFCAPIDILSMRAPKLEPPRPARNPNWPRRPSANRHRRSGRVRRPHRSRF